MAFAVFVGINAGILSAWRQNSWFDYVSMLIALIGVSMPIFWLGLMEQWLFALELKWTPSSGRMNVRDPIEAVTNIYLIDSLLSGRWDQFWTVVKHLILPGVALGTIPMAIIARMTRSSMLEVLRSDYIPHGQGELSQTFIIYKHALRNAFIPVLTVIGLQFGLLLGGAVLTGSDVSLARRQAILKNRDQFPGLSRHSVWNPDHRFDLCPNQSAGRSAVCGG